MDRGARAWMALIGGCCLAASVHSQDAIFATGHDEAAEGPYSKAQAARFLTQATFGPTLPEIDRLYRIGYNAWLTEQFAAPASLQLPFLDQLIAATPAGQSIEVWQDKRQEIWWRNSLSGSDQLRQRMAFALSQILVISDQSGALEGNPTAIAHFYDGLASGAFGNYRALLENVTLHPAMGQYLSMFKNRKTDAAQNIRPDENYAREIMQLFSIGLIQLNANGTPVDGNPGQAGVQTVPSYDQTVIAGFAKVFTGWSYSTCLPPVAAEDSPNFNWWHWEYCPSGPDNQDWRSHQGWRTPMKPWGEGTAFGDIYHESAGTKQLLNYPGVALANGVLPSGGTARSNLTAALNNVFNHPNVGPFLARLLIQRFTTSNPSPAYVGRVAAAFNNNGSNVRGDLRTVVRAILMDPEARSPAPTNGGKLREPLLRITQLWRALDARSNDNRIREGWPESYGAQAAQRSPTVFNFFLPRYQLPGEIATLGLYSPEFQITTDTYITRLSNELGGKIYWSWWGNPDLGTWDPMQVNLNRDTALATQPAELIERYNLLFLSGRMSSTMRNLLVAHISDINNSNTGSGWQRYRVQDALWLILTSPEYVVER